MRLRFSVRTFLVLCLLAGAVGLPYIWRASHVREIRALEEELGRLREQLSLNAHWRDYFLGDETPEEIRVRWNQSIKRSNEIAQRLTKLTGKHVKPFDD